jgi:hypothetical protein
VTEGVHDAHAIDDLLVLEILREQDVASGRVRRWRMSKICWDVEDLLAWRPVTIDGAVLRRSWSLEERFALSFWDALIVAAPAGPER